MNRLLIIGASGFGREVLDWALDIPSDRRDWEIGGFLDADPSALDGYGIDLPILGDPLSRQPARTDRFVCAIGEPVTKLKICRELQSRGARFATLIHPTAILGRHRRIGEGCVICPRGGMTSHVALGDFVTLNAYAGLGHDAVVGDGCTLSGYSEVTGKAILGEGVFLGSHAVILPGVKVGEYARIGAGSVVVRNVPPRASMFGNPAKQIAGFDPERP